MAIARENLRIGIGRGRIVCDTGIDINIIYPDTFLVRASRISRIKRGKKPWGETGEAVDKEKRITGATAI